MKRALTAIALTVALLARGGSAFVATVQDGPPPAPKPESEPPKPPPEEPAPKPKPESEPPKPKPEPESTPTKPEPTPSKPEPSKPLDTPGQDPTPVADRVVAHDRASLPTEIVPPASKLEGPAATSEPTVSASRSSLYFDASRTLDAGGYTALVERLLLEFPDHLRAQSLGKSRTGRDLWLLIASDMRIGDPSQKPAVCVCSDLSSPALGPGTSNLAPRDPSRSPTSAPALAAGGSKGAGPEAALYLVAKLLSDARTKPELSTLLQDSTLYVLPAMDPEQACPAQPSTADASPRACRLDRNFPVDWQPWGDAPGAQGPYPLSEPESQSIALFLAQRANVSAVVLLTRDARRLVPAPVDVAGAAQDRDERACQSVCALVSRPASGSDGNPIAPEARDGACAARLSPPGEIARAGGDFASFCEDFVGLSVFATRPWCGAPVETPLGPAPAGFEASATLVERLLKALPRLATDAPKVERLRNNLWMVDVELRNDGLLPTLCARLRARGAGPSVSLRTSGAKLIAVGLRRGAESGYEALRPQEGSAKIGHLEGEESFNLRVLVEAPENTTLEIIFESPRAGLKRVKVALQ